MRDEQLSDRRHSRGDDSHHRVDFKSSNLKGLRRTINMGLMNEIGYQQFAGRPMTNTTAASVIGLGKRSPANREARRRRASGCKSCSGCDDGSRVEVIFAGPAPTARDSKVRSTGLLAVPAAPLEGLPHLTKR